MIDSGGLKERRGRERERGRRDERGTGEVEERGEGASGSRFRGQNQQRPRDPQRFILIIPFGIFSLALHGVETSILIKEVSPPAAHWSRAKGQISRRDFRSIRGGGISYIFHYAVGVLEGFTGLLRISSGILFSIFAPRRLQIISGGPLFCCTRSSTMIVLCYGPWMGLTALNGREMLIGI